MNLGDTTADLVYTPLSPCRIIDTRVAGGFMTGGTTRSFVVAGTSAFALQGGTAGGCGVPVGATSVLINFVAVTPDGVGNLKGSAFPNPIPTTGSIINYQLLNPALNVANAVAFPICDPSVNTCTSDITLFTNGGGCHVVADVLGYFRRFPKEQTITSIVAGDGLSGGGTSGTVILGINTSAATAGQALTFNGTNTTWTTPAQGTITGVTAGSGLTGGGTSGTVSVAANFTAAGVMNGTANTVARGDHSHYTHTIIVSPGATPAACGTALANAIGGITISGPANPYLLKIEPGTYDIGTASINLKPYVDIEGSGEGMTTIVGSSTSYMFAAGDHSAIRWLTVQGVQYPIVATSVNVELDHVTIDVNNPAGDAYGPFFQGSGGTQVLNDVTIVATGLGAIPLSFITYGGGTTMSVFLHHVRTYATATGDNTHWAFGIQGGGVILDGEDVHVKAMSTTGGNVTGMTNNVIASLTSTLNLRNATFTLNANSGGITAISQNGSSSAKLTGILISATTVTGTALGITNSPADLTMTGSTVATAGAVAAAVYNTGATTQTIVIDNSRLVGATYTCYTPAPNISVFIANTKLEGGPVLSSGIASQCRFTVDETFNALVTGCP